MIRADDLNFMRAVVKAAAAPGPSVLATIVATRGSTPRKAGSRMLVHPDGSIEGTVGGGCGEGEVLEAAARVAKGGDAEMVRVDLTEDLLSWSPAVCGGIMEIMVERIPGLAMPEMAIPVDGEDSVEPSASPAAPAVQAMPASSATPTSPDQS